MPCSRLLTLCLYPAVKMLLVCVTLSGAIVLPAAIAEM